MEIGEKIHRLRIENDLTLEELGNKIGVGKSTVRKWEKGIIANMRRDKISAIANALGTTPAYLMGWEDDSDNNIEDNSYYINEDARDIANFMFRNPEYKVLFDATRKVKKEDIEFVKQMIDRMGNTNDDTGC